LAERVYPNRFPLSLTIYHYY